MLRHGLNYADSLVKSRPPGTVRIEIDNASRTITTVWEVVQIAIEFPLPAEHLSGDDVADILCAAHITVEALELGNSPDLFVDGDTVEVWQIDGGGEKKLLAAAEVSVTPLTCSECDLKGGSYAN
jgi:hypothetical protein